MRSLLFGAVLVLVVGCSDDPPGMLTLSPDATTVAVGASTLVQAFMEDGTTTMPPPVSADWSATPDGIITLTPTNDIQKVTGVAVGNVVVTANAYGQTAMIGFTVVSM